MRVAYFHNWSWLGGALGRALIEHGGDELWFIGGNAAKAERDPELIELARRARVLSVAPRDIGTAQFASRLARFAPDLIVVGTFPRKLPPALLAVPRLAAINVHASVLPRYRGALPEFWVIRNGETESGLTIHLMTDRFDAGRVLATAAIPLAIDENLLTLSMRLADIGPALLLGVLDRYRAGERPEGEAQDHALATAAPAVKPEHLLIHWDEPAASLERLLRAAYPVFEVHSYLRGQRIVVRRIAPARDVALSPGVIAIDMDQRRLLAGTGDHSVEISGVEVGLEVVSGFQLADRMALTSGERFSGPKM